MFFMKIKRVQKNICLLVMIFIWMFGMCHGLQQTDPIFLNARKNAFTISRVRDRLGEQDLYVEDSTNTSEICGTAVRVRRSRERRSFACFDSPLLLPENLPGNSQLQAGRRTGDILQENLSSAVIMEYVHDKDGAG